MPTLRDTFTGAQQQADDTLRLPKEIPAFPIEAFGERTDYARRTRVLQEWNEQVAAFWNTTNRRLTLGTQGTSTVVNNTTTATKNLRVSVGELTVAIEETNTALITAEEAIARRIVTVSALAGSSQNIKVQGTAPAGPALNDLWVDNTSLALPITYKWNGAAWAEVTEPISVAAVAAEQTARITADGNLSGKYTLTVIAGNVVTGMNITSSSGSGTDISSVIFRATDFLIYNGVTGQIMFDVSGTTVRLGGTLVVNTAGNKVYIGVGNYGAADTAFFVDSTGRFSLKDKLTWDGTTLTIVGAITATTGAIGGFNIGADYVRDVANSMGLASTVTGGDDVRFWAGDTFANRATAPLRITESGALVATSATISGTINGTAGYFGTGSGVVAITASGLDIGTSGHILGGQSAYNTGTGFWLGYSSGYKFSIGDASSSYLTWNGTTLAATGIEVAGGGGIFGGSGDNVWSAGTDGFRVGNVLLGPNIYVRNNGAGATELKVVDVPGVSYAEYRASGLTFHGDTNLYRNAANTLKTDDAFIALSLAGTGAGITTLDASNVSAGTLANARLPSAISVTSLTASGEIRGATARFGTHSAVGAETVTGFVTITDDGGTSRKLAVLS